MLWSLSPGLWSRPGSRAEVHVWCEGTADPAAPAQTLLSGPAPLSFIFTFLLILVVQGAEARLGRGGGTSFSKMLQAAGRPPGSGWGDP